MNIELIVFMSIWTISTEIIFFGFFREDSQPFFPQKITSVFAGFLVVIFLYGFPCLFATGAIDPAHAFGNVAYVVYYASLSFIALFFGVNYAIHKYLKKRSRRKG